MSYPSALNTPSITPQPGKNPGDVKPMVKKRIRINLVILFWVPCLFLGLTLGRVEGRDFGDYTEAIGKDEPTLPWIIEADTLGYNDKTNIYTAQGRVVIQKGDRMISAERIQFDRQKMTAVAEGNVRATAGSDFITGNRIEIDLLKKTGTIFEGYLYLRENNFHIKF